MRCCSPRWIMIDSSSRRTSGRQVNHNAALPCMPLFHFVVIYSVLMSSLSVLYLSFYSASPYHLPFALFLPLFVWPFHHSCLSQLWLLNKCISHMVELTFGSFSSAPYGGIFLKDIAQQQIFVYFRKSSLVVQLDSENLTFLSHTNCFILNNLNILKESSSSVCPVILVSDIQACNISGTCGLQGASFNLYIIRLGN